MEGLKLSDSLKMTMSEQGYYSIAASRGRAKMGKETVFTLEDNYQSAGAAQHKTLETDRLRFRRLPINPRRKQQSLMVAVP